MSRYALRSRSRQLLANLDDNDSEESSYTRRNNDRPSLFIPEGFKLVEFEEDVKRNSGGQEKEEEEDISSSSSSSSSVLDQDEATIRSRISQVQTQTQTQTQNQTQTQAPSPSFETIRLTLNVDKEARQPAEKKAHQDKIKSQASAKVPLDRTFRMDEQKKKTGRSQQFYDDTVQEIDKAYRPPYMPLLPPGDLQRLMSWLRMETRDYEALLRSKEYQFIRRVAGLSSEPLYEFIEQPGDMLQIPKWVVREPRSTTNVNAPVVASPQRRVTKRRTTKALDSDSDNIDGPLTTDIITGYTSDEDEDDNNDDVDVVGQREGTPTRSRLFNTPTKRSRLGYTLPNNTVNVVSRARPVPPSLDNYAGRTASVPESLAMYNAQRYLDRSQVRGTLYVSPLLGANVELAHSELLASVPGLASVPLSALKHDALAAPWFAELVARHIDIAQFMAARQARRRGGDYEKYVDRIQYIRYQFAQRLHWRPNEQRFVLRQNSTNNNNSSRYTLGQQRDARQARMHLMQTLTRNTFGYVRV